MYALRIGDGVKRYSQLRALLLGYATIVVGDGSTNNAAAITSANAQGRPIYFEGVSAPTTPVTISVPIINGWTQIFTPSATVTIDNGQPVRPDWFGADQPNAVRAAWTALPAAGGVVELGLRRYKANGLGYNGAYLNKDNVTIRGARMPRLSNDCRTLQGGSIIEGVLLVYANNVVLENFGVDCGATVIGAASPQDGILLTWPSDALKGASALRTRARLTNVIGLCKSPTDPVHAVIVAEGYSDVTCTGDVVGCMGVHGIVIKASSVQCEHLAAYCNASDGVIIKSDAQATAISSGVQIDRITALAGAPPGYAPFAVAAPGVNMGLFVHAFAASVTGVLIGQVYSSGHGYGVRMQLDAVFTVDNIQIGEVTTDNNANAGIHLYAPVAGELFKRVQFGRVVCRNTGSAMVFQYASAGDVSVGQLYGVNCSGAAVAATSASVPIIDTLVAENCAAVYQITGTAQVIVGHAFKRGTTTVDLLSSGGGQTVALQNGWTQTPGNDPFTVIPDRYGVTVRGTITPGTTNIVALLPPCLRPKVSKRLVGTAWNAANNVALPYVVVSDGRIGFNEATQNLAGVASWIELTGWFPLD
jgi:hypothetical protein